MSFIKPQVYAGMVREKFDSKVKVLQLAKNVGEIDGFRSVGETILFPQWSLATNKPVELTKGEVITTEELKQTSSTATIKQVAHGFLVYDIENKTALGNQIEEGASQQAQLFARKLDEDLITEAKTSTLVSPTANAKAITETELDTANMLFGDDLDVDTYAGIVVHSYLVPSFYSMESFTSAINTTSTANNGIVRNGLLGYFRGIPVFIANHGTYDDNAGECVSFIIKKNALGYMMKKDLNIELKREPEYKRTGIFTDMIYATKLLSDDGVVVIRKTTA
jgi:hypothetical protein